MSPKFSWTGGAALLVLAVALARAPSPESPLSGALREAGERRCLVLADFATDWCLWCRRLEVLVYPDPAVSRQLARVVYVKLNAELEGKADAEHYRVSGYPTLLFLTPEGNVAGRIEGFLPAPAMERRVRAILDPRSS
jgi:thiol:disulfide interchange protein